MLCVCLCVCACAHTHLLMCDVHTESMEMENSQMHFYQVNALIQPALGSRNGPF